MKKIVVYMVALACMLSIGLSGCANENALSENSIARKDLSGESADIVQLLLGGGRNVLLFEYKTDDKFKNADFWVETYDNGVLKNTPVLLETTNEEDGMDELFAVQIISNEGFQWFVSTTQEGLVKYSNNEPNGEVLDASLIQTSSWEVVEPIEIENNKELVLYASIYRHDDEPDMGMPATSFNDNPELVKDYAYVQLIKCKFY